jgi:hypothetical protein
VAVHNDYYVGGEQRTFWLFTNSETGQFVRGEANTDGEALRLCLIRIDRLEEMERLSRPEEIP